MFRGHFRGLTWDITWDITSDITWDIMCLGTFQGFNLNTTVKQDKGGCGLEFVV